MDVEQEEMQFLGIIGILRETSKLIYRWRRIFTQITLALILPLCFILLAHMELSHLFVRKIFHDEIALYHTQTTTPKFQKLSDIVSSERVYFFLFQITYFIFSIIFSLLSTSAVVYTVACIYTAREVTFKQVMTVVPKVWKRLLITYFCMFLSSFAFIVIALSVLIMLVFIIMFLIVGPYGNGYIFVAYFLEALFFVGYVYLILIWQLSSVVTVLEDSCGFKAMGKSQGLIKGKMMVALVIFILVSLPLGGIRLVFGHVVVRGVWLGMASRGILGIVCFLLLFVFFLLKLVTETVLYFVCKSYHHENIDKSALSDHLQVYLLAEYVPLMAKDVQLEKLQV